MHFIRGNCGHLKAKCDNYPSCLSFTACLRSSPCYFCSVWSDKVWNLAEKNRLCSTRRLVMTQRRKQKKNKKRIQSDLSDTGSHDGSTALHSYTARGRTHQGSSPWDQISDQALSPPVTSQPVPVVQSLVDQSPVNLSLVSQSLVSQSPVNQSTNHRSSRRSRVQPPPKSATFFRGDWSWNIFYGHSLPSTDSRRAIVSFWRKIVHNTG